MIRKLVNSCISLVFIFYANNIMSEDLIPAEYFACYGNNHSMQMSPDGKYIAIVTQPRDDKCDILNQISKNELKMIIEVEN